MHKALSTHEAEKSRKQHGSNELVRTAHNSFFKQFLQSFSDPIIKILLIALAVNVIFFIRNFNWYETVGIAVAILLATFVSTLSEYGSESAFEQLQQDAAKIKCRIRRAEGVVTLPLGEIVVGDLVLLQTGERIPADGVIISGELSVDQSALNGESKEAHKTPQIYDGTATGFLNAQSLFRGTVVTEGEGVMLVEKVGASTFYGKLAQEVQDETRESPLKFRLRKLAGTISIFGYAAAGVVTIANLFNCILLDNKFDPALITAYFANRQLFIGDLLRVLTLAITVVVMAVPEGLPMMITVVLSSNMKRMIKDNVLVRKLVGIETSGSLNILFTDKTGTLTRGRLIFKRFISGSGAEYDSPAQVKRQSALWEQLYLSCLHNNSAQMGTQNAKKAPVGGNATDRALLEYIMPYIKEKTKTATERVSYLPFTSKSKFSAAELINDGKRVHLVKGAPEKIMAGCTAYIDESGEVKPFSSHTLQYKINQLTGESYRLIALAVSDMPVSSSGTFSNLTLIGIAAIRDVVRPEAKAAIAQVTRAGIQTVMVTGDNRDTAVSIAQAVGLIRSNYTDEVITSAEMAQLSDEQLKNRLPRLRVVARALPSDKSRLIRLSQEMGLVAGMTGDGANDAPALKKADVGFAMGNGTEVAKEAGDIVILDDNIASIAKAILYGRTIFKSIRKFIIFQLTVNFCAVAISVISPFIGIDTPITVIQMLWINIIMDTLAGLAFAGERPLKEYMDEPPKKRDEPIINRYMYSQTAFTGTYTVLLCTLFLKLPLFRDMMIGGGDGYLMTAFFALFIFAGIFNSINARTPRINLLAHIYGNKIFVFIMAAVAVIQILIIYRGGSIFRTTGLEFHDLRLVVLLALTVIPVDLLRKRLMKIRTNAV